MAAGTSLGVSAPLSPVVLPAVFATRSRRLHGAFCVDTRVARIWSSRRAGDARGVLLALGTDTPAELNGRYTPEQARRIARALTSAADAVELQIGAAPTLPPQPTSLPPLRSRAARPHFSDRPFGFDPRWQVRHRVACEEPAVRLPGPRYIGGGIARDQQPGASREGGAA